MEEDFSQLGTSIYKIKTEKSINHKLEMIEGAGFFMQIDEPYIPFKKCFITSNNIIDENDINNKNEIRIGYEAEEKQIEIKNNRKIYMDKNIGYTCIEILEEEDLMVNYLKISKEEIDDLKNEKIIIPEYINNYELSYPIGKILSITKDELTYDYSSPKESLGMPILLNSSCEEVLGINIKYDSDKKCHITIPIKNIISNMNHQICPLAFNEDIDIDEIDEDIFGLLKNFPNIDNKSFLSIMHDKFNGVSIPKLAFGLAKHVLVQDMEDVYQNEIIRKYCSNTNIIYDTNNDDDTIINFISKVLGKSNLGCFYSYTIFIDDHEMECRNLIYLNGKAELVNNKFGFLDNDIFVYGNYGKINDDIYDYTSFRGQNSSIYTNFKNNAIYVIFYRIYTDNIEVLILIKIVNNFMTNKIMITEDSEVFETLEEKYSENNTFGDIDELFENSTNKYEVNFKELIVYQINENS